VQIGKATLTRHDDAAAVSLADFGPWNPGIESQVPEHLRHLCTIFRPENGFTSVANARELRDLTVWS
jgi:hypothetical protein